MATTKKEIKIKCESCKEITKITAPEEAEKLLEAVNACPCCGAKKIKKIWVEKSKAAKVDNIELSISSEDIKDEFGDTETTYIIKMNVYDRVAWSFISAQIKEMFPDVKYSRKYAGWITQDEAIAEKVILVVNSNPTTEERNEIKAGYNKK